MRRALAFTLLMLALVAPLRAQDGGINGFVLIRSLEIGVENDPNSLFLADTGSGRVTELSVSNAGVFAPWFDWSPDGRRFAFLSPARRGINDELWLGDANTFAPNLRAPLFDLNLTPVAARWNPEFNIVAVGTQSENTVQDGLFLFNANTNRLVHLREESLARNTFLDWAHGGFWLTFTGADGSLNMIHTETESRVTLQAPIDPPPALLPDHVTGWTSDDAYYVFSNTTYGGIAAITTDGEGVPAQFAPEFVRDPFQIKLAVDDNQLVALYDNRLLTTDLSSGELERIDIQTEAVIAPDYGLAEDGSLVLNTFVEEEDRDVATCMILRPGEAVPTPIVDELGIDNWVHTRCKLLEGGGYIAIMGTNAGESYENLPEFWLFDLMIVPVSLRGSVFLTNEYVGFEAGSIGFSPEREQLIFREGDNLVVYNLQGQKLTLASLQQLRLTSNFIDFAYAWQP